ncbi:hypothetical protein AXG93_960s1110 [Marchantia polymorpha subsp. ruderalis]|uniref:Uncharacterized protein n=1 Tax=Marchantia polymorpha subsp. ruderalis TaxID=1480154 RepID=A0A176VID5_MARPO|nr:hypothetical protein AXG93_960s1110 [Marchantia polymorpha subsp. ruderalis]
MQMGTAWELLACDTVPTSQAMKPTARLPSLFQTLNLRQIRTSKVRQFPYEGEWTSDGQTSGEGVLTVQNQSYRAPPLSLSFAKKRWEGEMLAVADEEGYVSIFNTNGQLPSMVDCFSKTRDVRSKLWMAHTNAVFDVCWTKDDTHILTASGDQTIRLWDIENKRGVGVMMGHSGSVKSLCVHPSQSDLFVSGSRDGTVAFWDLRSQSGSLAGCSKYMPVTKIKDAHKGVMNARRRKGYTRSVTAVLYLKDERLVATAGANDGVVKFWDTRKLKCPVTHSPSERVSSGTRMHGIAGLSQDPSGTRLIATCVDSKIYMYDVMGLAKGELKTFSGHTMGSFYIKASFSPDGSHILGGSTDHNAYLWKVDRPEDAPTLLRGHSGEVTAVDWCPMEHCKVATCSDDYTVRVWNLRAPRFSQRLTPKYNGFPSCRRQEESHVVQDYSYSNILGLEDSQHPLQTSLPQHEKTHPTDKDGHLNILRLVEDSQHPLPLGSRPYLLTTATEDGTNIEHNPFSTSSQRTESSETNSLSEDEQQDVNAAKSTATSFDFKRIHFGSTKAPPIKRTRVLFSSKDRLPDEVFTIHSVQSSEERRHQGEEANITPRTQRGSSEKQVTPPFKRTRVPFRDLNGDGGKTGGISLSVAEVQVDSSRQFSDSEKENDYSYVGLKNSVGDKHSTPPFKRSRALSDFSTHAENECEVRRCQEDSPLGQSDGSPSSVLSPPSSLQRRRKTIMDYFSLRPLSSEACPKTGKGSG